MFLPGGRFRGRPPWSAPSDRTTTTLQRPAGSSAPQRRSDPSFPWRRRDVWALPTSLKNDTQQHITAFQHMLDVRISSISELSASFIQRGSTIKVKSDSRSDRMTAGIRANPILGQN